MGGVGNTTWPYFHRFRSAATIAYFLLRPVLLNERLDQAKFQGHLEFLKLKLSKTIGPYLTFEMYWVYPVNASVVYQHRKIYCLVRFFPPSHTRTTCVAILMRR